MDVGRHSLAGEGDASHGAHVQHNRRRSNDTDGARCMHVLVDTRTSYASKHAAALHVAASTDLLHPTTTCTFSTL